MNVMHLISGGDSGGAKTHVFALLDQLKLHCNIVVGCLMRGVFYNEILQKDIETILFEQKNRLDLSVIQDIAKTIRKRKIELLHVHGARANFIAMFIKKKIHIPIVTTMHSDYLLDFDTFVKKHVFKNLNILALKKIDYFIAVSDSFKDMLIERGFRPNSIQTVYNGMDFSLVPKTVTSKEAFAAKYGLELDDKYTYIGIAARFDSVKGVDIFIKGCAKAYEKRKNLRFLIAGDGADREMLQALVKQCAIENVTTFLGYVTDMYGFLNFIDINTLTSLCESFPYSMLEGAAMKKPMVASRVGGIPALVCDGETGFLFESQNYEQMADRLILLADNREDARIMGENIYQKATTNFSSKAFAEKHVRIYQNILSDYYAKKKYDFVLSGYFGFNNSGDDALLLALLSDLKTEKQNARMIVLSQNPLQTKKQFKVDAIKRMSPLQLLHTLRKSDILLSGGGSLIQDETSTQSLWYYLAIIKFAKLCGMKVMQIANGIGPLTGKSNRKLAAKTMNHNVDYITLREQRSLTELHSLGVDIPSEVTADPAISLVGISNKKVRTILDENGVPKGDYVCVAVRPWKKKAPDFEASIANAMDHVCTVYKQTVVFVPMQYPLDLSISEDIVSKMKHKAYVIQKRCSIEEMIGIIHYSSLVVAMRLHSLVYAVSCGVGIVAIQYDPKINGFMDYFRQTRIVDAQTLKETDLIAMIDDYFRENNTESAANLCREMKEKARKNAQLAVKLLEIKNGIQK